MLNQYKKRKNEKGIALVIAILITSALVAIGSFAMVMTNTELDISKNDRFGKEAFFFTDGAGSIYTRIISNIYWNNAVGTYGNISINENFINEVMNYANNNDGATDAPDSDPDITYDWNGRHLDMDIDWRTRRAGPGGSLLTHMGYEGVGLNKSYGGVEIYFDVNSVGRTAPLARNYGFSRAQIQSVYKR